MKKRQTRKRRSSQRKTHKRRQQGGYGDQTFYFITEESLSRPGYPVMRVLSTEGDGMGGFMSFEQYLSDIMYDIEGQLLALKLNRANKKVPKRAVVKKFVIRKPFYVPKTTTP